MFLPSRSNDRRPNGPQEVGVKKKADDGAKLDPNDCHGLNQGIGNELPKKKVFDAPGRKGKNFLKCWKPKKLCKKCLRKETE